MADPLHAALFVADFPVAVLRKEGGSSPAVVACGQPPKRFVHAADALARECRVREGMALAAAQARCGAAGAGRLQVFERDEGLELRMQRRLLQLAGDATPLLEDVAPGLVALDCVGLREPYAAMEMLAAGAARLGLEASIGVARNRFVALCAARTRRGVTHVYPGREAGFLQALPLDMLPLDGGDIQTLERWGVRTVGALGRLSEDELVERFGERGARMARLARGEEGAPLRAYRPPARFELGEDFDWEVGELDSLACAMAPLLDRLCRQLQSLDRAAARLTVRLKLAGGGWFERTVDLPSPLSDARTLLALVRIELAAHPPGAAVEGVRVAADPAGRRRLQQSLFAPDSPSPERLAVTLARLGGLVGSARVGAPSVPDTHRPGAAVLQAFRAGGEGAAAQRKRAAGPAPAPPSGSPLVLRCFRPFRPTEVALRGSRPVRIAAPGVRGPVTACAGPWRCSGEWWTPDGWQHQEWDVEVRRRLYRVCCERATGAWFLTGEYD